MGFIKVTARKANVTSLVTNKKNIIQNFRFSDLLENSKINSQPTENRDKNANIWKKFEGDTIYHVLTPQGGICLD